jgi:peptide methionine sulfoxide reductase msrA/msrB
MKGRRKALSAAVLVLLVGAVVAVVLAAKRDGTENTVEKAMEERTRVEVATLAGGCFWCVEADMARLPGVIRVVSGYAGGEEESPTYEQVSSGRTGHREAVQVEFDPAVVGYDEVLDHFWRHFDPTDDGGSFGDRGAQYTSAIFYHDERQREIAEASRAALDASGRFDAPVVTPVLPFTTFYEAEKYHQDYSERNPIRYKTYRALSGRDRFVRETWGKADRGPGPRAAVTGPDETYVRPDDATLRRTLTPLQFEVVRRDGTEPPFDNEYWDNHREGIYVDVVSGEPLFSSTDKFDSGTGWPSFTRPLSEDAVVLRRDDGLFTVRTEVRSRLADSHLGHVFDDGPAPTGLRYCMNSAALRFIPREALEAEGYGDFAGLFE